MSDRFDKVAKGLASGVSRRRFLKLLAGGTVASVAAFIPDEKPAGAFFWGSPGYGGNQSYPPPNQGMPVWGMPGHYQPEGSSNPAMPGGWPVFTPGRNRGSWGPNEPQ